MTVVSGVVIPPIGVVIPPIGVVIPPLGVVIPKELRDGFYPRDPEQAYHSGRSSLRISVTSGVPRMGTILCYAAR
jgi:hypothetical protein